MNLEETFELLKPKAQQQSFPLDQLRKICSSVFRYADSSIQLLPSDGKPSARPFESIPLSKFLETTPSEIDWWIDQILPCQGSGILAGAPGIGKSWLLLDLAIESARGGKWLGHFQLKQGAVLYFDEESAPIPLCDRISRLLKAKELIGIPLDIHLCVGKGLKLTEPNSVKRLCQELEKVKPGLLIIDSLIRVHNAEENSASAMAQVDDVIKKLRDEYKCSVVIADHHGKSEYSKPENQLRGSSEKLAFVDFLFSMNRGKDDLRIDHSKARWTIAVPPFLVRIQSPTPETVVIEYVGEAASDFKSPPSEAVKLWIIKQVKTDEGRTRKELIDLGKPLNYSHHAIDAALPELVNEGLLEKIKSPSTSGRGGQQDYYRIKPDS